MINILFIISTCFNFISGISKSIIPRFLDFLLNISDNFCITKSIAEYSKDLSLTEAKKGFSKEWEESKEKIGLLQEMIDEQKSEEKVNHPKRQINEEEFE